MKEILERLQALQLEVMEYENYSMTTMNCKDWIHASLHLPKKDILFSLDFVNKDYLEKANKQLDIFERKVFAELGSCRNNEFLIKK